MATPVLSKGELGRDFHGGVIKINVDGAFLVKTGVASIGVVAQDFHGLMIDGCAHVLHGVHTAKTAEACAFVADIKMTVANGWNRAVAEGDSMSMVNKLSSPSQDLYVAAVFLAEAKQLLKTQPLIKVVHVGREVNHLAHSLAH